ncbi:diguanylate cyclase (GGDEF)-like protein [Nocardia pseudobrasiliensis]|uniref:Diguanylate cyclase (GGDEF)-like protein n=2 Tax=Nocardia pseudobrasiliensis TaxID=45979 RepID=A0A370I8F7_9NOCA|nr:diguanylate cyclase (GGDEF)-like protein [Nocardia pseudobrasiliensis]
MGDSRALLLAWWRDRVDYRWLVDVLAYHRALGLVKVMLGSGGAVMCLVTALSMISHIGPRNAFFAIGCLLIVILTATWALRWWLLPWPGRVESLLWCAGADLAITFGAVAAQNRLYGALVTTLLTVPGMYAGAFHGQRILAAHVGWSLLSTGTLVVLLILDDPAHTGAAAGDGRLGAAIALIIVSLSVIGLPTAQFCRWVWRLNAISDPLTLLLNRRGLDYHLSRYLCPGHGTVYVATLDLDRFKSVNDTFGHPFGDRVLQHTAHRLRAAAAPDALVARIGGEEFVVLGYLRDARPSEIAEQLRHAIATMPDLPTTITASVGLTTIGPTDKFDPADVQRALQDADWAMYRAKRMGGNAFAITETTVLPHRPPVRTVKV